MQHWLTLLSALFMLIRVAHGINETIWLTDNAGRDTITVRVGQVVDIQVRINTNTTYVSGFQCFVTFNEAVATPVPYNASPTGWFLDNHLSIEGDVVFADNHDIRFPNNPLPHHQFDWCYQTRVAVPRPVFVANGVACTFRVRFLQPMENHVIRFDHDNNNFRNTLYWEGQSAVEHPFYREYPMVVNVIGMDFGPLPDVYLTSPAPRDSINLHDYLSEIEGVHPDSVNFTYRPLGGPNTTCTVDSLRVPGAWWMIFNTLGPGNWVDLAVTAHAIGLSDIDTLRVFQGDAPLIDDAMGDIELPFVTWLEDSSTSVDLDPWVTDLDDPVEDLIWSLLPGNHTVSMVIDPVHRRGHFTSPSNWFGLDSLLLRVVDPGGMADTSRLYAQVLPVNDAPVLSLPVLAAVHPGQPLVLDLEAMTQDIDHAYDQLYWTVSGDTSQIAARVDLAARTLILEVKPGAVLWSYVDFTLRVTDLGGLWDEDVLHTQVASHPPLWSPIGEVFVQSGSSTQVSLNDFVSDQDNTDEQLQIWFQGMTQVQVSVDPASHVATFSAPAVWTGVERLHAFARDPEQNQDIDTLLVVVLQGGNPLVALVPDMVFLPGARDSLNLDAFVWDFDTPDNQMTWEVSNSGLFQTIVRPSSRRVVYTAPMTPGSVDQSVYIATDPQGHSAQDIGSLAVIDPSGRPLIFPLEEIWMRVNAVDSSLVLDQLVYDYDDAVDELVWTLGTGSLVGGSIRSTDRRLFINSYFQPGQETLSLTVRDPGGNEASGALVVHVTEGRSPIVSVFAPRYVIAGQTDTLRNLSNWVYDPDPGDRISWTFIDPPASQVRAVWQQSRDQAYIMTDPAHRGVDLIGAVATDQANNSDLEWITLHSLENQPPRLEAAILVNPGEPRLLDMVVISDEPLRSISARRAGDGALLAFSEVVVANPSVRIYRADLSAPQGAETWRISALDLPGYPQVPGNSAVDSLVFGSAVLAWPGDGLDSPDEALGLVWSSGLSNGRWVIVEDENESGDRQWRLIGPAEGRVGLVERAGELEMLCQGSWQPWEDGAEGRSGDLLRPSTGLSATEQPAAFSLHDAQPNPFNPITRISYSLERMGRVRLEIMDLLGRRVRGLVNDFEEAGQRQVVWDACDDSGVPVASGVYFVRLRHEDRQAVRKLILAR